MTEYPTITVNAAAYELGWNEEEIKEGQRYATEYGATAEVKMVMFDYDFALLAPNPTTRADKQLRLWANIAVGSIDVDAIATQAEKARLVKAHAIQLYKLGVDLDYRTFRLFPHVLNTTIMGPEPDVIKLIDSLATTIGGPYDFAIDIWEVEQMERLVHHPQIEKIHIESTL